MNPLQIPTQFTRGAAQQQQQQQQLSLSQFQSQHFQKKPSSTTMTT